MADQAATKRAVDLLKRINSAVQFPLHPYLRRQLVEAIELLEPAPARRGDG